LWWLTLREECRLRVFQNRVLRRIFGPKRDEVTGEWRRLHDEELYALYSSPNIIRVIKLRRLDNIKMNLREVGLGGIDKIDLAWDRDRWRAVVSTVMNLRVP
jgi:hypothetical protein